MPNNKNTMGRIQHKRDTEANWKRATGFAPLAGELIVYDYGNSKSPRLKVGSTGVNVNDLLFTSVGSENANGGQIFIDYENNEAAIKATAMGDMVIASGRRSLATGFLTEAGNTAAAFGRLSKATGKGAHAEGIEAYNDLDSNGVRYPKTQNPVAVTDCVTIQVEDALDLVAGDSIELVPEGDAKGFTATDCRRIVKIERNADNTATIIEINAPFLADNYYPGKNCPANGIIPTGARIKKAVPSRATAEAAHAEGSGTLASGPESHAQGQKTQATEWCAHAEGYETKANAQVTHVEGYRTVASTKHQHVQGRYNDLDDTNYAHIVGGGVLNSGSDWSKEENITRRNIHTIDWNGNARFQGRVSVGPKGSATYLATVDELSSGLAERLSTTSPKGAGSLSMNRRTGTTAGTNSFVGGSNSIASGSVSTAIGFRAKASGTRSSAFGEDSWSRGQSAFASGRGTIAWGNFSHTEGTYSQSTTQYTMGVEEIDGVGTYYSTGDKTTAVSQGDFVAVYKDSTVIEVTTIATISYDSAKNRTYYTFTHTPTSTATKFKPAYPVLAKGEASHAEGYSTVAGGENQHVQGQFNILDDVSAGNTKTKNKIGRYAHILGNGTSDAARSNAHTIDWNGNAWFQGELRLGGSSYDSGNKVVTCGSNGLISKEFLPMSEFLSLGETAATAYRGDHGKTAYDHSQSQGNPHGLTADDLNVYTKDYIDANCTGSGGIGIAGLGNYSEVFNDLINNIALAEYSHAEGYHTEAGTRATDEYDNYIDCDGNVVDYDDAQIIGAYSHAEGYWSKAYGTCSHAEGHKTRALFDHSHAEGYMTVAAGPHTHSQGHGAIATGAEAHAEGHYTKAWGNRSHVQGYYTVAASSDQFVTGVANLIDENNNYLVVVGNGTVFNGSSGENLEYDYNNNYLGSSTTRSNAHTLDWSGNAWFSGDIYVGGTCKSDANRLPITYSGTDEPDPELGQDGDIYIMY